MSNVITIRNWTKRAVCSGDDNRLMGWAVIEKSGIMRIDLDELPVNGRLHLPNFVEKDSSIEDLKEESNKVRERVQELLLERVAVELVKESLERAVTLHLEEIKEIKGILKEALEVFENLHCEYSCDREAVKEAIEQIRFTLND